MTKKGSAKAANGSGAVSNKDSSGLRITIDRLFYDETGQIIVSALFGLALALLFRRICKDNCVLYSAPDIKEIEENIFNLEDTCYKYKSYPVKCNDLDKPLEPYDINKTPDNLISVPGFFEKIFFT
jgi:hypothetical protein